MFTKIRAQREQWQVKLDEIAQNTGLHSLLIMESLPQSMKVVVANAQDVYKAEEEGPKSVQLGCHELYCERVVNTQEPLLVPDATADPEWRGNEDLVKFGLGVYLGYPLIAKDGQVVGTICALNREAFDFSANNPSAAERLELLQRELEAELD